MYCPKCSQLQISDQVRFCSRCGFQLSDPSATVSVAPGANEPKDDRSPLKKGVRQGVVLIILSIILLPAYILLAPLFPANDRLVESAVSDTPFEKTSQAILITIFILGLARILYAWFFQRTPASAAREGEKPGQLKDSEANYALPAADPIPASGFGAWRGNTGEVVRAPAKSERTTKSRDRE